VESLFTFLTTLPTPDEYVVIVLNLFDHTRLHLRSRVKVPVADVSTWCVRRTRCRRGLTLPPAGRVVALRSAARYRESTSR
jgi:hypothetical protein